MTFGKGRGSEGDGVAHPHRGFWVESTRCLRSGAGDAPLSTLGSWGHPGALHSEMTSEAFTIWDSCEGVSRSELHSQAVTRKTSHASGRLQGHLLPGLAVLTGNGPFRIRASLAKQSGCGRGPSPRPGPRCCGMSPPGGAE